MSLERKGRKRRYQRAMSPIGNQFSSFLHDDYDNLRTPRMDVYTCAFSYPSRNSVDGASFENVHAICSQTMQDHNVAVVYAPADDDGRSFSFLISGGYPQVLAARGFILRECPMQVSLSDVGEFESQLTAVIDSLVHPRPPLRNTRLSSTIKCSSSQTADQEKVG